MSCLKFPFLHAQIRQPDTQIILLKKQNMKKFTILAIGAVALLASCKKDDKPASCEVSVAGITGNYKISKIEIVVSGLAQDATNIYLEACERDDIYQLKADKTVVYQDAGTTCSPSGAGAGTWDVVSGKLNIAHSGNGWEFDNAPVVNNCSNLVSEQSLGGSTLRITLTKQ